MRLKRMILPGRFVEAFLYFDFLWLVDAEGKVSAFDPWGFWSSRSGDEARAARSVFGRNSELVQSQGDVASYDQQTRLVQAFINAQDVILTDAEVERHSILFDTRVDGRSVLDMRCYYGRAFVATERGISQFRLHNRQDLAHMGVGTRGNGRLGGEVVHDGGCIQFRSKYGVVSAACGGDGAFYAKGAASDDPTWRPRFERFADRSRATEFVGRTMANVDHGSDLEFYETEVCERPEASVEAPDADAEREEVTNVGSIEKGSARANASIRQEGDRRSVSYTRFFLTSGAVFALGDDNALQRFSLVRRGQVADPVARTPFSIAPDDIIGMTTCPLGIVAEMVGSVGLLRDEAWFPLKEEPVYAVRGYPASKWYRNLITIVGEGAVDLAFISA